MTTAYQTHRSYAKDPAVIDRLVALYNGGNGITWVAEAMKLAPDTVRVRLMERGVTIRSTHGPGPTEEQMARMVERYEAGDTLRTVGKALGYGPPTVRVVLLARGVVIRTGHRYQDGHPGRKVGATSRRRSKCACRPVSSWDVLWANAEFRRCVSAGISCLAVARRGLFVVTVSTIGHGGGTIPRDGVRYATGVGGALMEDEAVAATLRVCGGRWLCEVGDVCLPVPADLGVADDRSWDEWGGN